MRVGIGLVGFAELLYFARSDLKILLWRSQHEPSIDVEDTARQTLGVNSASCSSAEVVVFFSAFGGAEAALAFFFSSD